MTGYSSIDLDDDLSSNLLSDLDKLNSRNAVFRDYSMQIYVRIRGELSGFQRRERRDDPLLVKVVNAGSPLLPSQSKLNGNKIIDVLHLYLLEDVDIVRHI